MRTFLNIINVVLMTVCNVNRSMAFDTIVKQNVEVQHVKERHNYGTIDANEKCNN